MDRGLLSSAAPSLLLPPTFIKPRRPLLLTLSPPPSLSLSTPIIISRPFPVGYDAGRRRLSLNISGSSSAQAPEPPELSTRSLGEDGIWSQMKEIALFAGPATGLWICGPLMSLIDTMVIGQSSSLELAALGPATVVCDYLSYIFMFLSIATSNLVATSLAKKDNDLAQHQISMLLFVAFACGLGMFLFTKLLGPQILSGIPGLKEENMVCHKEIRKEARMGKCLRIDDEQNND